VKHQHVRCCNELLPEARAKCSIANAIESVALKAHTHAIRLYAIELISGISDVKETTFTIERQAQFNGAFQFLI
jgi:hypothetical protein